MHNNKISGRVRGRHLRLVTQTNQTARTTRAGVRAWLINTLNLASAHTMQLSATLWTRKLCEWTMNSLKIWTKRKWAWKKKKPTLLLWQNGCKCWFTGLVLVICTHRNSCLCLVVASGGLGGVREKSTHQCQRERGERERQQVDCATTKRDKDVGGEHEVQREVERGSWSLCEERAWTKRAQGGCSLRSMKLIQISTAAVCVMFPCFLLFSSFFLISHALNLKLEVNAMFKALLVPTPLCSPRFNPVPVYFNSPTPEKEKLAGERCFEGVWSSTKISDSVFFISVTR